MQYMQRAQRNHEFVGVRWSGIFLRALAAMRYVMLQEWIVKTSKLDTEVYIHKGRYNEEGGWDRGRDEK